MGDITIMKQKIEKLENDEDFKVKKIESKEQQANRKRKIKNRNIGRTQVYED